MKTGSFNIFIPLVCKFLYFSTMKVLQFPLARVTLVFSIGIVIAYLVQPSPILVFSSLFIAALFSGAAYFWSRQKPLHNRYFGLTIFGLAFAVGMSTQTIHTDSYQKNHDISLGFNPRNILDCRAKIGLPSISFKNKYTISTFIAIEPESPNFELFIKNFFEKKIEKGVTHAKLIIIELYEQSMHLINKTDISILSVNELKIHLHRENVRATQINK